MQQVSARYAQNTENRTHISLVWTWRTTCSQVLAPNLTTLTLCSSPRSPAANAISLHTHMLWFRHYRKRS